MPEASPRLSFGDQTQLKPRKLLWTPPLPGGRPEKPVWSRHTRSLHDTVRCPAIPETSEVDMSQAHLLGRGTYGQVYGGFMRDGLSFVRDTESPAAGGMATVAIKRHVESEAGPLTGLSIATIREINYLKLLRHAPNMARLVCVCVKCSEEDTGRRAMIDSDTRGVDELMTHRWMLRMTKDEGKDKEKEKEKDGENKDGDGDGASQKGDAPEGPPRPTPYREVYMVFERADHDLTGLKRSPEFTSRLQERHARLIVKEIAVALQHCHRMKIAHRDLKLANVLIAGRHCQLTDFGLARYIKAGSSGVPPLTSKVCTLWYRPPECFLQQPFNNARYGLGIDIWSLGCCMFEVITGKALFPVYADNDADKLTLHAIYSMIGTPDQQWPAGKDLRGYRDDSMRPPPEASARAQPAMPGVSGCRPLLDTNKPGQRKFVPRTSTTTPIMPTMMKNHPLTREVLGGCRWGTGQAAVSVEGLDLLFWMLQLDPAARPTIDQVLCHSWFHSPILPALPKELDILPKTSQLEITQHMARARGARSGSEEPPRPQAPAHRGYQPQPNRGRYGPRPQRRRAPEQRQGQGVQERPRARARFVRSSQ